MSVGLSEDDDGATAVVALPFKDAGFYLVLALPKEGTTPSQMLSSESADELMNLVTHPDQMKTAQVGLQVPKFNVTMGNELTSLLSSLPGLSSAFGPNADYSKITNQ